LIKKAAEGQDAESYKEIGRARTALHDSAQLCLKRYQYDIAIKRWQLP